MKSKILMAALLSGAVLAAGAAQAKEHRERPDFVTLDLNGDGSLSLEELQAQGQARFANVDTNADGALSAEELIAAARDRASERAARMIERQDDNGDGVLQIDEMPSRGDGDRAEQMFERVDADSDGAISQEEFETAKERQGGRCDQGKRDRG
ncbi:MAG: Ca2+-binding EF-hand superfamily protein [Yoonia sp.]|jgi:Ca2+-binding EF-hand superfamily protein